MDSAGHPHTLSIVLPCYNPKPDWEKAFVDTILQYREQLPVKNINSILVNDGSTTNITSGHLEYVRSKLDHFHYIELPENRGKGHELRRGVEETDSDLYIYTDVDFPYTVESVIAIYNGLHQKEVDVAVAVREESYYDKVPFLRKVISHSLKLMIRNLLSMDITDTQGGLKGFNKRGKEVFLKTIIERYLFDLEFVYQCSNDKAIQIIPVVVRLNEGVTFSKVGFKELWKEGINFLKILFIRK